MGGDTTVLIMWGYIIAICGVIAIVYQLMSGYISNMNKEDNDG